MAEHTQKITCLCNEKGKRCELAQIVSLCGIVHDMGKNKQMMVSYVVAVHHGLFDCVDKGHMDAFPQKLRKVDDYEEAYDNAKRDYLDEYEVDRIFTDASEFCKLHQETERIIYVSPLLTASATVPEKSRSPRGSIFKACLHHGNFANKEIKYIAGTE